MNEEICLVFSVYAGSERIGVFENIETAARYAEKVRLLPQNICQWKVYRVVNEYRILKRNT